MCISHLNIRSTLPSPFSEYRVDKTDGAGFISHVLHQQTDICLSYSQIVHTVHLASAAVSRSVSAGQPSFRHINTDYSRIPRHCTLVIAITTSEIYVYEAQQTLPICWTVSVCYGSLQCQIFQPQKMRNTMLSYNGGCGSSKKNLCCASFLHALHKFSH